MSIVSNYIWEKGLDGGRNPVSLIAQQAGLKGREKLSRYDVASVIRYEGN